MSGDQQRTQMKGPPKSVPRSHAAFLAEPSSLNDHTDDELKAAMRDTSKNITNLFNTLIGFGLFSILALATPDVSLLGTSASVRVPMAGSIAFKTFILLGPALLLALRFSLYAYVNHGIALDSERKKRRLGAPAEIAPLRHPVLRIFTTPLLYLFVPFLLVFFAWKGAAIPEWASILWSLAGIALAFHIYLFLVRYPLPFLPLPAAIAVLVTVSGAFVAFTLTDPDIFRRSLELSRADLSKQYLFGQNFEGANLSYSNISDSDLGSAVLTGADLTGAVLTSADFRTAYLRRAILYNANLESADLRGAKLEGAAFYRATLLNANFDGAHLMNANFEEADLRGANLQRANLKGTNLFLSNLSQADLRNVVNLDCNQLVQALGGWHSAYRSPELACGAAIPSRDQEQGNPPAGKTKGEATGEFGLVKRKTFDNTEIEIE